jgi:hypothetical protein
VSGAGTLATADLHAPVVDAVLQAAAQMLGMEVVFLGSFTETDYDFLRVIGDIPGFGEGDTRPMDATLCQSMLEGAPPFTSDAASVDEYSSIQVVASNSVTSYIGVPVVVHGEVVGTLCGIDRNSVTVGPEALAVMNALSSVISAHVETGTVLRRSAAGWQVGDTAALDLTSAMTLADLLAEDVTPAGRPARPDPETLTETDRLRLAVTQLEHALAARVTVEQSIGVLTERLGVTPRAAFERLRKSSRTRGLRVHDVAQDVVDSATDPTVDLPPELVAER